LLKHFMLAAAVAAFSLPTALMAQSWELEARRVSTNYQARGSAEPVPSGWGGVARYIARRPVFLEFEYSAGVDYRFGAICGGFLIDPATQCIPETVRYSGSVVGVSAGLAGRVRVGSRWSYGARPKIGLGAIDAGQHGQDTGREHSETRLAVSAGLAAQVSHHIPEFGVGISAFAEASQVRPLRITSCEDCMEVLRASVARLAYGITLIWEPSGHR
jgi:hypothetical protein